VAPRVVRLRDEIDAVRAEGTTAQQPANTQPGSAKSSVHVERLQGVVRARGVETTRGEVSREELLIAANEGPKCPSGRRTRRWLAQGLFGGEYGVRHM